MAEFTLGQEEIRLIQACEDQINKWTRGQQGPRLNVLDCVADEDRLVFLVAHGHLGLAIGKDARNLKRLKDLFHKEVKFLEFHPEKEPFVTNLFKPYPPETLEVVQKMGGGPLVATVSLQEEHKGKAIGKGGRNINLIRQLARRHHDIDEVKVL